MRIVFSTTVLMIMMLASIPSAYAHLYFGYGSNLSIKFMNERLKDGKWTEDGWHKTGTLKSAPKVEGCYVLPEYAFYYNLIVEMENGKITETAANVTPEKGKTVYGVVYDLNEDQLAELDKTENYTIDKPETSSYIRQLLQVYPCSGSANTSQTKQVWVYIGVERPGNLVKDSEQFCPSRYYVDLLVAGAKRQSEIPTDYIQSTLNWKSWVTEPVLSVEYF